MGRLKSEDIEALWGNVKPVEEIEEVEDEIPEEKTAPDGGEQLPEYVERKFGRGRHKKNCDCPKCTRKYGPVENRNNDKSVDANVRNRPIQNDRATTESIERELSEELKNVGASETERADGEEIAADETEIEGDNENVEEKSVVLISGSLFLIVIDNIIPRIILKLAKFMGMGLNKKVKDLKLTDEEMEQLLPIADKIADELFSNLSPLNQFLIAYGSIVLGKLDD